MMERYESYKDSGVKWIGEIPSHWKKIPLGKLGVFYGGLTGKKGDDFHSKDNSLNKPFIPFTNIFNNIYISKDHFQYVIIKNDENQNKVRKLDLFFLMSSEDYDDLGKSSILIEDVEELYLNSFCKGFRITRTDVYPLFLNQQLLGDTHKKLISIEGNGFTRINLRQERLKATPVFIPPFDEQEQIVSFLDNKNSIIESLIRKSQRKIELLREQRTSIINEVVTKGLNSNVKMKDSRVEYIGKIPSHWEIKPLKYLLSYTKGFAFKSEVFCDEGIPIVKASDVKQGTIKSPNVFLNPKSLDSYQKVTLKTGDIVISTVGSQYSVAGSAVGQLAIVPKKLDGSLLNHLDIHSHGTANQASLNVEDILNFNIIFPEIRDQKKIVESLQRDLTKIDKCMNFETNKVDLLKEYRRSLFSSIVTGKVKVSEDII